jgi:hypothetical protein
VVEIPVMIPLQTWLPVPSFRALINTCGYPNIIQYLDGFTEYPSKQNQTNGWIWGSPHFWKPSMPRYLLPSSGLFRGQPWKGLAIGMLRPTYGHQMINLETVSMKHLQFCQKWILMNHTSTLDMLSNLTT